MTTPGDGVVDHDDVLDALGHSRKRDEDHVGVLHHDLCHAHVVLISRPTGVWIVIVAPAALFGGAKLIR